MEAEGVEGDEELVIEYSFGEYTKPFELGEATLGMQEGFAVEELSENKVKDELQKIEGAEAEAVSPPLEGGEQGEVVPSQSVTSVETQAVPEQASLEQAVSEQILPQESATPTEGAGETGQVQGARTGEGGDGKQGHLGKAQGLAVSF